VGKGGLKVRNIEKKTSNQRNRERKKSRIGGV
jgi:hypothetical protein